MSDKSPIDEAIASYRLGSGKDFDVGLVDVFRSEFARAIDYVSFTDEPIPDMRPDRRNKDLRYIVSIHRWHTQARSVKLGNLFADPAKSLAAASSASFAAMKVGIPAAATFPALATPALAIICILATAHLARRVDVVYADACVLYVAWAVSRDAGEWREFSPGELRDGFDRYSTDLNIKPPVDDDAMQTSIRKLVALNAIKQIADGKYQLLEEVELK